MSCWQSLNECACVCILLQISDLESYQEDITNHLDFFFLSFALFIGYGIIFYIPSNTMFLLSRGYYYLSGTDTVQNISVQSLWKLGEKGVNKLFQRTVLDI